MNYMIASEARKTLYKLIDKVANEHEPAIIVGKRNKAVLISEEDWEGLQETLHLYSSPDLIKQIIQSSEEPLEDCVSHEEAWK